MAIVFITSACGGDGSNDGITEEAAVRLQPWPVGFVTATGADGLVEVAWEDQGGAHHFEIYRQQEGETAWTRLANVDGRCSEVGEYRYRDTSTVSGTRYVYGVSNIACVFTTSPPGPGLDGGITTSNVVVAP